MIHQKMNIETRKGKQGGRENGKKVAREALPGLEPGFWEFDDQNPK